VHQFVGEQNHCSQYYSKFTTPWLLAIFSDHPGSKCTKGQLIYATRFTCTKWTKQSIFSESKLIGSLWLSRSYRSDGSQPQAQ
jgi:hypothetical protein